MDFLTLCGNRYSTRAFDTRAVEDEKLTKVLEAGRLAPTAKNNQPQLIYVLKGKEAREKVKECSPCTFDAPVVLVVCVDKNLCWNSLEDERTSAQIDGAIVATQMMLEAAEQGLGSCFVLRFDPNAFAKAFHLAPSLVPVCLLPIGYASEDGTPSERHFKRKPVEQITFNL